MTRNSQQSEESVEEILRKYRIVRKAVQKWVDNQGHERCWYYPEIFREIAETLNIKPTGPINLAPRQEFRPNCNRYEEEIYEQGKL